MNKLKQNIKTWQCTCSCRMGCNSCSTVHMAPCCQCCGAARFWQLQLQLELEPAPTKKGRLRAAPQHCLLQYVQSVFLHFFPRFDGLGVTTGTVTKKYDFDHCCGSELIYFGSGSGYNFSEFRIRRSRICNLQYRTHFIAYLPRYRVPHLTKFISLFKTQLSFKLEKWL